MAASIYISRAINAYNTTYAQNKNYHPLKYINYLLRFAQKLMISSFGKQFTTSHTNV